MEGSEQDFGRVIEDVDRKSEVILQAVAELEDSKEKVETPDVTDLINVERQMVHYRIDRYLEPHGLVETEQPISEGGPAPPKQISLTDLGREFIGFLQGRSEGDFSTGLGERLSRMEDHIDGLQSKIISLEEQLDRVETGDVDREIEGGNNSQSDLQQQIGELAMEVEELKDDPVFNPGVRGQLDAARLAAIGFRELLVEEFGEERVEENISEYQNRIQPTLRD